MERRVKVISDNIISPLGMTSQQNYEAVLAGRSMVSLHTDVEGLKEPAMVSMLDRDAVLSEASSYHIPCSFTFFETVCALSILKALEGTDVDPRSGRTALVFSTTKANVSLLDSRTPYDENTIPRETRYLPGVSARLIAVFLGNPNEPVTVSNACISGVCAEILAARMIAQGSYDNVIVCGSDIQCLFIISGFQSFKALSQSQCRPFDAKRDGLNLGEAAATVILSSEGEGWSLRSGAIRNDANHISGPSRTGEGSFRAIDAIYGGKNPSDLSFINVHGTSTLYNDEMESIAVSRAGLSDVPLGALKGNFGHTMGAAGVLESIISMKASEGGVVPGTRGFSEMGVSCPVNISSQTRPVQGNSFIKLLSGFGGCNAAALFTREDVPFEVSSRSTAFRKVSTVRITPESVVLNGVRIEAEGRGKDLVDSVFREHIGSYPKYFKMDTLSRLGFVASELLLKDEPGRFTPRDDRAVVLFGTTSSLCNDRNYQQTVQDPDNYYPSPALFVYTLANIVTGEISIRNKYLSETSFYVLGRKDEDTMKRIISTTFLDDAVGSMLTGWLDCTSDDDFAAEISLVERIEP